MVEEKHPADLASSRQPESSGRSPSDSRVVCYLDRVTSDGYIEGWARDESEPRACILQILQNGEVIGEMVADCFRQDLLDAGIGHGHYAFYARLYDAKPGEFDLEVAEKHLGTRISVTGPARHMIPVMERSRPVAVQELVRRRRWTANDLVRNIGCLHLSENARTMGSFRFVDVTYFFLLNRWMDEAALVHVRKLEGGETSPEEFFTEVALSEERLASSSVLPGPYDGRFPYKLF